MQTALLPNASIVTANDYVPSIHGEQIRCIDKNCEAPVIFVAGTEKAAPYFKTTGKGASVHAEACGFYRTLTFEEAIKKVKEYQDEYIKVQADSGIKGLPQVVVRFNFNSIDPDYVSKSSVREESEPKPKGGLGVEIKDSKTHPANVTSVKSVVKLLANNEPDQLSSIIVNIKGYKVPLSFLIIDQEQAHTLLWENTSQANRFSFFVYGKIEKVTRREKVYYISFVIENETKPSFTVVIFQQYFDNFTYTDAQLIGRKVLVYGQLRKNTYNGKNLTEMVIKSDKYLSFLPN